MPHGLPRRIRLAFITQALLSSVVIALGLLAVGIVVRHVLVEYRLEREAQTFFAQRAVVPDTPAPGGAFLQAWFVPSGASDEGVPAGLRKLPPGLHDPWVGAPFDRIDYVERRPAGTFYARYSSKTLDEAILWTAMLALLLSLAAVYLTSWLTWRTSAQLIAPVGWLADAVACWDPRDPDARAVAPRNLPDDASIEVRHLSAALSGLAERVGDFVERERDFTRDASHELRTPVTVVRVACDLLLADETLTARQRRSLTRIQQAGRDMEAVIDAFLILAREADVQPQSDAFDVMDVVHEEVERVRPLIAGKSVIIDVSHTDPPRLYAPRRVLNVMLGNLLSNAAHFTDSGEIHVSVSHDRIEVRDTGIGMSAASLERAFDPFWRVDMNREEGKGMGLSIVRRLGERFGWPVTLASVEGQGTQATIRFLG